MPIFLLSCSTLQPTTFEELSRTRRPPDRMVLTLVDGRRVVVLGPEIRVDSVLGVSHDRNNQVRLARSDIRSVESKRFHGGATGMAVVGGTLVGLPLIWFLLFVSAGGPR